MKIICVSGNRPGAGKDTAAKYIADNYGYTHMSLAHPIKVFAREVFSFTENQMWGDSPHRKDVVNVDWYRSARILSTECDAWLKDIGHGTKEAKQHLVDWFVALKNEHPKTVTPRLVLQSLGTEFGRDKLGHEVWVNYLLKGLTSDSRVVVSDVRFLDELETLRKYGKSIKIQRDGTDIHTHKSETGMNAVPASYFDLLVNNNHDIYQLYETLDLFMNQQE